MLAEWFTVVPKLRGVFAGHLGRSLGVTFQDAGSWIPNPWYHGACFCLFQDVSFPLASIPCPQCQQSHSPHPIAHLPIFSFLSNRKRKRQTSSSASLDQMQNPFRSHLNYVDLLTFDLGKTEGKVTEFDLLDSLGKSGEGFSGDGRETVGRGEQEGEISGNSISSRKTLLPPIPSWVQSPFSVLTSVPASVTLQNDTP